MKNPTTRRELMLLVTLFGAASTISVGCKKENANTLTKLEERNTAAIGIQKLLTVNTILAPQNITSTTGRFFIENQATPNNTAYMVVRWQDDTSHPGNAISINPTYNPVTYTGYTPPTPYSSWQKGEFDDAVNGSPVFQLNGTYGGMMMNSWFSTYQTIVGGGENTVYEYKFSTPTTPWSTGTSSLWVQADLKLPWFANWDINSNGIKPIGQLSYHIYLKDTSINKVLAIIVNAYDNRPSVPGEAVGTDTFTYFASTRFGGTRYSTPNAYSASWRSSTWSTYSFYRAEITRQNIINIATDINAAYGQSFSLNPSNYVLTSSGILQETFREQGDQVSMGSSFRDFSIHENY